MLVKPFSQRIDPDKVFDIQNHQYTEKLLLADTVPANSTKLGKVSIANLGHFFCQFVTGSFTTIGTGAGVDSGISYLSGQLIDGSGQRKLFNDRIPLDLFLSPGRRKSNLAGAAASGLFFPIEFEYLFTKNSDILFDVVNTSDQDNEYEIVFHGIRIVSDMVVSNMVQSGGRVVRTAQQPQRRG